MKLMTLAEAIEAGEALTRLMNCCAMCRQEFASGVEAFTWLADEVAQLREDLAEAYRYITALDAENATLHGQIGSLEAEMYAEVSLS